MSRHSRIGDRQDDLLRSVVRERRGPKVIDSSTSISHAAASSSRRCPNFDLRNVLLSSLSALW